MTTKGKEIEVLRYLTKVFVRIVVIIIMIILSPVLLGVFIVSFSNKEERKFIRFIKDLLR